MDSFWQVQLKGHEFDLEDLPGQFTSPALRVVEQDDAYWLESAEFDGLPNDSAEVLAVATDLLVRINGATRLLNPSHEGVQLAGMARRPGEGGILVMTVDAVITRE